jgi:hypothetical protein
MSLLPSLDNPKSAGRTAGNGTGMLPMTWETGTHSVIPSLRVMSETKILPEAT